jgi:hypothetical protein
MAQQQEAADLVRGLGSASPAEQLEAARGLEQLAVAPGGAQRIQRAGGVPALVRLLQGGGSEALQATAANALARMVAQEQDMARDICTAGAGRDLVQSLPTSRSPAAARTLLFLDMLITAGGQQQLLHELAASPSCLGRVAQLATDPSQPAAAQRQALGLLAGPVMGASSPSTVAAAAAPHAAALVQHLSPRAAAGIPDPCVEQLYAAHLLAVVADERAEGAASILAAGALPRLAQLMSAPSPLQRLKQVAAVAALERLVARQPSAAGQLAAINGITKALVQVLASHQPPASCQQAWDKAAAATNGQALVLLGETSDADAAQATGAVAAATRVLRWGANRLEWLASRVQWELEAEESCQHACCALLYLLGNSRHSSVKSAAQAELPQLVQPALQHCRGQDALRAASLLLALLRDPGTVQSVPAMNQGAAEVLRQLQPGGHPDRAAAVAALLADLSGEEQPEAGGSGAGAAPVGPSGSSGGAAQQAGAQKEAVAAECAACHALPPAGRKFQVCAGCMAVRYCSPACQKAGWRSGHKAACRAQGVGAQGGGR